MNTWRYARSYSNVRIQPLLQSRLKAASFVARGHQFSLFLDASVSHTIEALSLQTLFAGRFRRYGNGSVLYSKGQRPNKTQADRICICLDVCKHRAVYSCRSTCHFRTFHSQQRSTRTICKALTHSITIEPVQEITNTSETKGMQDLVTLNCFTNELPSRQAMQKACGEVRA